MSLNICLSKKFLLSRLMGSARSWRLGLRLYKQSLRSGSLWSAWLSFAKTLANKVPSSSATRWATAESYERFETLSSDMTRSPTTQARDTVSLRLPQTWRWRLEASSLHTYHGIEVQRLSTLANDRLLDTCSVIDRRLEMVTPNMVIVVTRRIPGSTGGLQSRALRLLPMNTISSDCPLFSVRLLQCAYVSTWSSSVFQENTEIS